MNTTRTRIIRTRTIRVAAGARVAANGESGHGVLRFRGCRPASLA